MAKTVFSLNSLRVDFTVHGDRDERNACNSNTNIITIAIIPKNKIFVSIRIL